MPSDPHTYPWQHCRVVSLEHDHDRRLHIDDQLTRAGIPYEFAAGIPGSSLDRDVLLAEGTVVAHMLDRERVPLWASLNQVGCSMAHLAVLSEVACAPEERPTLIFEDDADLVDDFAARATALIDRVPADAEMLYFGHLFADASDTPPAIGVEPARVPRGTYAYLVWPSAAVTVLEHAHPIKIAFDEYLVDLIVRSRVSAYVANPAIVEQRQSLGSSVHRPPEGAR